MEANQHVFSHLHSLAGVEAGSDTKSGERTRGDNGKWKICTYLCTYYELSTLLNFRDEKRNKMLPSPLNPTFKEISLVKRENTIIHWYILSFSAIYKTCLMRKSSFTTFFKSFIIVQFCKCSEDKKGWVSLRNSTWREARISKMKSSEIWTEWTIYFNVHQDGLSEQYECSATREINFAWKDIIPGLDPGSQSVL